MNEDAMGLALMKCTFPFLSFCDCPPNFNALVSKMDESNILETTVVYCNSMMQLKTNAKPTFGTVKSISIKLSMLANNLQRMLFRNYIHLIYGNRMMSDVFHNNSASRQYSFVEFCIQY